MKRTDRILCHMIEGPLMTLICLAIFLVYAAFVHKAAALIIAGILLCAFFVAEFYHSVVLAWEYLVRKQIRQKITRVQSFDGSEKLTLLRCPYLKIHLNDSELGNKLFRVINQPDFEILPDQKIRIDYLKQSKIILKVELTI